MTDDDAATVIRLLTQILSRLEAIERQLAAQGDARQEADPSGQARGQALLPVYGAVPVPKKKR